MPLELVSHVSRLALNSNQRTLADRERSDTDTQEPNAKGMHTFPDLLDMRLVNKVVGSLIELQKE